MALRNVGGYKIEQELGSGSAGTAYVGVHPESGKRVAVKLLSRQMSQDELMQKRFIREMSVMSKLRHENIVELFDCGLHDDQFFIAMEWVDYGTLKLILTTRDSIPWRETCECAIQICRGLALAHEKGIVHRDLKPANVFISQDGHLKLGDFGLAKDADGISLTLEGMTVGTCQYMSPEQIEGSREIDGRLDLYALGCMIFEMITGKQPYQGATVMELLQQHQNAAPPDLRKSVPSCPAELAILVQDLLAKNMDDRPANATIVADRLQAILSGHTRPAGKEQPAFIDRLSGSQERKISWKMLAAVGGVIAVVIAVVMLMQRK